MEVKEAIEFLDHMANSFKCISSLNCKSIDNKKNEIVDLLQQGEKYKKIVYEINNERLFNEYDSVYTIPSNIHKDIHKTIKEIIEKYFPKEK